VSEQEQISRLLTILREMDVYSDVDTGIILEHIKHLQSEIEQLNKQLEGAIVPKFKIGQEVFSPEYYNARTVSKILVACIINRRFQDGRTCNPQLVAESELFASQEEAQASLRKEGE